MYIAEDSETFFVEQDVVQVRMVFHERGFFFAVRPSDHFQRSCP